MKTLKTFEKWTSDIKHYFLTDDGELDYESWYKTWKITKSKLYSNKSGYVLFEYPPLEPDWDESPTFTEIEWIFDSSYLFQYDSHDNSLNDSLLEWELEDKMIYYIMFETLKDDEIRIKVFNNNIVYFNDETAETVENGKYLEQYNELKKKSSIKKFKI